MATYTQPEDFTVTGFQVKAFPNGIKEAFGRLMKTFGGRDYYGISWMDENDQVVYYAMAKEAFEGEGAQHKYESITLKKGDYQTETLHNWMSQTGRIKDVLHNLMGDSKPDRENPCIEWYQSDDDMVCIIRKA